MEQPGVAPSDLPFAGPDGSKQHVRRSMQLHLPKLAELLLPSCTDVRMVHTLHLVPSRLLVRTFRGFVPPLSHETKRAPLSNVQERPWLMIVEDAAPHMACRTWHLCLAV